MITISVDEAEAFDRLSILWVKQSHMMPVSQEEKRLMDQLTDQVPKILEILNSDEFQELHDANLGTFRAVEKATSNSITPRELQEWNMRRFAAKQSLQTKFWPSAPLSEVKSHKILCLYDMHP